MKLKFAKSTLIQYLKHLRSYFLLASIWSEFVGFKFWKWSDSSWFDPLLFNVNVHKQILKISSKQNENCMKIWTLWCWSSSHKILKTCKVHLIHFCVCSIIHCIIILYYIFYFIIYFTEVTIGHNIYVNWIFGFAQDLGDPDYFKI